MIHWCWIRFGHQLSGGLLDSEQVGRLGLKMTSASEEVRVREYLYYAPCRMQRSMQPRHLVSIQGKDMYVINMGCFVLTNLLLSILEAGMSVFRLVFSSPRCLYISITTTPHTSQEP